MIAAAEFVRPAGMALLDKLAQLGVPLADLTADSRTVKLGSIFVAYPGTAQDGRAYIAEAISRGATAVIWERDGFSWKEAWEIPNLGVENLRSRISEIARAAARIAERPSSGCIPECAARPWKVTSIDCENGAPRMTSPIGAAWSYT